MFGPSSQQEGDIGESIQDNGTPRVDPGASASERTGTHIGASSNIEDIQDDLHYSIQVYNKLMADEISADTVCSNRILETVQQKLLNHISTMSGYATARLWLQYMEMINLLRMFRTENWLLHLNTLQDMLPNFAAAGHNLYAKSANIYLQQMLKLETDNPDVFTDFTTGYTLFDAVIGSGLDFHLTW
ncbi:hypothetical protein BSL78_20086 [Apostichopus japonicus]|uniref:Uncharacterized protein n=1 Tax=Stichopus japonicus TaxID=307972 RepID=A0A2G8K4W2_STIJA|nr:hypothetical protein BSL78_20086 [Apostichopus japonicus]